MKRKDTHRREALLRIHQFLKDYPEATSNLRVGTLLAEIAAVLEETDDFEVDQHLGNGRSRGGTAECHRIADELRTSMRLISDMAKALDRSEFPGLAEQLRMPRKGYAKLQGHATAFLEAIAPVKQAFVERMLSADFDLQLQRLNDGLSRALNRRISGKVKQIKGTAGIEDTVRRGMKLVRELDAIMRVAYANDPALLAAWKGAVRIKRERRTAPPVAPGESSPIADVHVPDGQPDPSIAFNRREMHVAGAFMLHRNSGVHTKRIHEAPVNAHESHRSLPPYPPQPSAPTPEQHLPSGHRTPAGVRSGDVELGLDRAPADPRLPVSRPPECAQR
jgi:hypothetical protein